MAFEVKPYSPEIYGDLEDYIRECYDHMVSNMFFGVKYYFEIRDKGLMRPIFTYVRVGQNPAPDVDYFVNSQFLLESYGPGEYNMNCMGAEKGVYDPKKTLKGRIWSISGLKLWEDIPE